VPEQPVQVPLRRQVPLPQELPALFEPGEPVRFEAQRVRLALARARPQPVFALQERQEKQVLQQLQRLAERQREQPVALAQAAGPAPVSVPQPLASPALRLRAARDEPFLPRRQRSNSSGSFSRLRQTPATGQ
jgi:hypothetical protein